MNPASLSLHHLVRKPVAPGAKPPLLILLHGLGSNEQDLFSLAPEFDERFLIISARAPLTLMSGSYAWFHADLSSGHPLINAEEAESSRTTLLQFIDEAARRYDVDPSRVYLVGFSQGAIMSLSVMLTQPEAVAGVVAMSGRILPEIRHITAAPDRLEGLPVMVVHGTLDQVLPVFNGRASRDYLSTLPVKLTYREYPMAHGIDEESFADVSAWLSTQLDGKKQELAPRMDQEQ